MTDEHLLKTLGAIPCKFNFGLQGQLYSAKAKSPKINGNDQYTLKIFIYLDSGIDKFHCHFAAAKITY